MCCFYEHRKWFPYNAKYLKGILHQLSQQQHHPHMSHLEDFVGFYFPWITCAFLSPWPFHSSQTIHFSSYSFSVHPILISFLPPNVSSYGLLIQALLPPFHPPTSLSFLLSLCSALSISKDVASPVIREHLHNRPMVVKPVPQAAPATNDLC